MLDRIGVHSLVSPAMHRQISLGVPIEVEAANRHRTGHSVFEDARSGLPVTLRHDPRQADVCRYYTHYVFSGRTSQDLSVSF